ncbi:hypothetical protein [Tardiphaga robiniae]
MFQIIGVFAEFERAIIRERVANVVRIGHEKAAIRTTKIKLAIVTSS